MSLSELWALWANGTVDSDTTVWGIRLLWWGRAGKILQFLGALTIVLDLLGDRVGQFAELVTRGMQASLKIVGVGLRVVSVVATVLLLLLLLPGLIYFLPRQAEASAWSHSGWVIAAALAVALVGALVVWRQEKLATLPADQEPSVWSRARHVGVLVLLSYPTGVLTVLFAALLIPLALPFLIVLGVVWAVRQLFGRDALPLRLLALALFLIGFPLDLLAS